MSGFDKEKIRFMDKLFAFIFPSRPCCLASLITLRLGIYGTLLYSMDVDAYPKPAPKLECSQPVFNFGERESFGEVEHNFVVRNTGDLTLQIINLRSTCGCLIPKVNDKLVPPRGEVNIPVKFVLRGRQGPQSKIVYVDSNDPVYPTFPLRIEGQIVDPVGLEPRLLFLGRVAAHASVTGSLMLVASGSNALGQVTAQMDSSAFTVHVNPRLNPKSVRLEVVSQPPLPEGLTRASLRITTGHARVPSMTTVVSIFVPGAFSVVPPELLLVGREGEFVRREITLRSESNLAFRIQAVEPPFQEMPSTVLTVNASNYQIVFPKIPVKRMLEGQSVRIVTDHPTRPEILIPIRVFLR
jgi:hypothetical protein